MPAIRLILAVALCTAQLHAQSVVVAAGADQGRQGAIAGVGKKISIDVKGVTLEYALRTIARSAGLDIVYGRAERALQQKVSVRVDGVTVEEALAQTTRGTGVITVIAPDGKSLIVQRERGKGVSQGLITGKVTDAKSGRGIAGAIVSIAGDTKGVISGEDGTYRLAGVPAGMQLVSIRSVGYAKQSRTVTLAEGATAMVDFKLEASANVLDQVVVTGTVVASELKSIPNAISVVTAKQLEERGITRIEELFRGDIPGLFASNQGTMSENGEVLMFSRGATAISTKSAGVTTTGGRQVLTNAIKTYIDGVEMTDPRFISQIDVKSIERIEILTGPQASTIYGSNALNGVMQIFTKRGSGTRPSLVLDFSSSLAQNNFSTSLAPSHFADARLSGTESRLSYAVGTSAMYMGAWAPGNHIAQTGVNGAVKSDYKTLSLDLSTRHTNFNNKTRGTLSQSNAGFAETGVYNQNLTPGSNAARYKGVGNTFGITTRYTPVSWWSHELVLGTDAIDRDGMILTANFTSPSDSTVNRTTNSNQRQSQSYNTTLNLPLGSNARFTLTGGADHWRTKGMMVLTSGSPSQNGSSFPSVSITRDKPSKNSGGYLQSQFAIWDALFLTYGLRAEWNPNFGEEQSPNIAPRYGVAYAREMGALTAKLRASYGRSTRPPDATLKDPVSFAKTYPFDAPTLLREYGPQDATLANPDLAPEYQQGGEGGVELYFGNRGSIVVTRYNQTVDNLISFVGNSDSARSIIPFPTWYNCCTLAADNYGYLGQSQHINVGSIRNQGWELQGSTNIGPFTTRGTYSWTKSRIIGITPRYRALLPSVQTGRSFSYVPEHTWALTTGYTRMSTNMAVTVNGIGQIFKEQDNVHLMSSTFLRLRPVSAFRWTVPTTYRGLGTGYVTADLNGSHRFSRNMDATLQIRNLGDYYRNDFRSDYATIGRQSRAGLRVRF